LASKSLPRSLPPPCTLRHQDSRIAHGPNATPASLRPSSTSRSPAPHTAKRQASLPTHRTCIVSRQPWVGPGHRLAIPAVRGGKLLQQPVPGVARCLGQGAHLELLQLGVRTQQIPAPKSRGKERGGGGLKYWDRGGGGRQFSAHRHTCSCPAAAHRPASGTTGLPPSRSAAGRPPLTGCRAARPACAHGPAQTAAHWRQSPRA
jgi:hypothetical protein